MEKKEPHPEKRPHLEGSFCTVGFLISKYVQKMPTNGKKDKAGIRTRNSEATARRVTHYGFDQQG